jgi:hypothetical protein
MFLTGGGMRGGSAHRHIEGSPFLGEWRTGRSYRLFAIRDRFPALCPVEAGGQPIRGELYDVPMERLRDELLPAESPELELGIIELESGAASLAMMLRQTERVPGRHLDITGHGGWRSYLEARDTPAKGVAR